MSWIRDTKDKRTWLQKLCANVLKTGPIPKHVAFIMDGNRRFAKKNSIDRAHGHLMGFDKLAQVCVTPVIMQEIFHILGYHSLVCNKHQNDVRVPQLLHCASV